MRDILHTFGKRSIALCQICYRRSREQLSRFAHLQFLQHFRVNYQVCRPFVRAIELWLGWLCLRVFRNCPRRQGNDANSN